MLYELRYRRLQDTSVHNNKIYGRLGLNTETSVNGGNMNQRSQSRHAAKWMMSGLFATAAMAALLSAAPAMAGSVTQPGETIGLATGSPLPEGWYALDTTDYGQRTPPSNESIGVTIPVIAWSTPYHLLGARVQALVAAPLVEASTPGSHVSGWYNPWVAGQLAWDLGNGFGASYLLGVYAGVDSPVADHSTSLNQRFALSYVANSYTLSANVIYGSQFGSKTAPDYVNLDLTATKSFGKWSVGPVGYYSSDVSKPTPGYQEQSQFALGGLVGYNFGPVVMQTYLTRGVAQSNYGGDDTRFWFRFLVPLS